MTRKTQTVQELPGSQTANEKNNGEVNISNHAHNLLTDIGSLTLEKKKRHFRRTAVFVLLKKIMLNLIFVVVVFVDCFLRYSCAVRPHICFGLYMCGIGRGGVCADGYLNLLLSGGPRCFQSLCLPTRTVLYQKHSGDERVTVYYISINKKQVALFSSFPPVSERFDVNIWYFPIFSTHTHTMTCTHTHSA